MKHLKLFEDVGSDLPSRDEMVKMLSDIFAELIDDGAFIDNDNDYGDDKIVIEFNKINVVKEYFSLLSLEPPKYTTSQIIKIHKDYLNFLQDVEVCINRLKDEFNIDDDLGIFNLDHISTNSGGLILSLLIEFKV